MDAKETITQKIIEALENGTTPWKCPFHRTAYPVNFKTGHNYRGVNMFMLWLTAMMSGYTTNYFIGFQQARSLGGHVRRKESGIQIIVYSPYKKTVINNTTGAEEEVSRKFFKSDYVFNLDQIEGLKIETENPEITPIEEIEALVKNTGVFIRHQGERAYFDNLNDFINMPYRSNFETLEEYYATMFHELIHSTGHKSRINRLDISSKEDKAFEELVAELGSAFLCAEYNLPQNIKNTAAYVDSWLASLKKDTGYIFKASKVATEAIVYLQNLSIKEQGEKLCA